MRISSNSYALNLSQYASASKATSTSEEETSTSTISGAELLERIKAQLESRDSSGSVSTDYADLLAGGQYVKQNIRIEPVDNAERTEKMENIRSSFDAIKDADLDSLTDEEAATLLSNLQSSLSAMTSSESSSTKKNASFEAISKIDVSSLSSEELKSALSSIQEEAQTMSKAGGGKRPNGPPPMGPPPSGAPGGAAGTSGTSSTEETEETDEIDTLEELLEYLAEKAEEEKELAAKSEKISENFTAIQKSNIDTLSDDAAKELLSALQSSLTGVKSPDGSLEELSSLDVSNMSSDEIKETLSTVQDRVNEMSQVGMGRRPEGPPPTQASASVSSITAVDETDTTNETEEIDTVDELLEYLQKQQDDKKTNLSSSLVDKLASLLFEEGQTSSV